MERHEAFLSCNGFVLGKDALEGKSFMACISKVTGTDSTHPFHQNHVHVPGEYGICDTAVIIIRFGGCHGELLHNFNYLDFDPNMQQFIQRHADAWHSFCLDHPPVPFHPPSIFTFSAQRTTIFCRCPRVLFRKGTSSVKVKTTKYSIDRRNLRYSIFGKLSALKDLFALSSHLDLELLVGEKQETNNNSKISLQSYPVIP